MYRYLRPFLIITTARICTAKLKQKFTCRQFNFLLQSLTTRQQLAMRAALIDNVKGVSHIESLQYPHSL